MYGSQGYQPHYQGRQYSHQERPHGERRSQRRRGKRKPDNYSPHNGPQHHGRHTRVTQPVGYFQNQTRTSGGLHGQPPQRQAHPLAACRT